MGPNVDQNHWLGKAMGKAAFLGGSASLARHAPANPSGAAVPQAPTNPSGVAAPQVPAWHGLKEIEEKIGKLDVENAAMKVELEQMASQVQALEGLENRAQADTQNQQGSRKVFMGFGAFALGGGLGYSIIQKMFPSSQNRHGSRVAPLMMAVAGAITMALTMAISPTPAFAADEFDPTIFLVPVLLILGTIYLVVVIYNGGKK